MLLHATSKACVCVCVRAHVCVTVSVCVWMNRLMNHSVYVLVCLSFKC